ncbi:unnamed protein product [Lampetra planeri]
MGDERGLFSGGCGQPRRADVVRAAPRWEVAFTAGPRRRLISEQEGDFLDQTFEWSLEQHQQQHQQQQHQQQHQQQQHQQQHQQQQHQQHQQQQHQQQYQQQQHQQQHQQHQ